MVNFYMIDGEAKPDSQFTLDAEDAGLLYGFGLFETILVRSGIPIFLDLHLNRLERSAAELGITLPMGVDKFFSMCVQGINKSRIREGVMRLAVTAGKTGNKQGRTILIIKDIISYQTQQYDKGFKILTIDYPRNEQSPLVRHKTANYLENLLTRQKVKSLGYDEGLFLNFRGEVAECCASNIFFVIKDKLLTPPVDAGLLPGIVRGLVMGRLAGLVGGCEEKNITVSELAEAEECFVTNSLMGIMPVVSIDLKPVGSGNIGSVTRKMMEDYNRLLGIQNSKNDQKLK